jgi:hypothetical protein
MSYSQGGLIEAVDYNNFINGTNQLNTVWAVGSGAAGYGQTALSTVAVGSIVTATQWATLINTLNNVRSHQTGSGSGISAVSAGQQIDHLSTLQTQVDNAFTQRGNFSTQGGTTTGSTFTTAVSSTTGLGEWQVIDRVVTFQSANQARYFFNAGGQLNLVLGTNSGNGSGSTNSLIRLITGLGGLGLRNTVNTGRTGTGIQLDTNNTALGYRNNVFNGPQNAVFVTDNTASYTGSNGVIQLFTSSSDTTNGSVGANVVFRVLYDVDNKTWDDTIGVNITSRVDIVRPNATFLTDVWGTITVS